MKRLSLIVSLIASLSVWGQEKIDTLKTYEGYYVCAFETSDFFEDSHSLPSWMSFDIPIQFVDSLYQKFSSESFYRAMSKGVYVKIAGLKKTGGNYGHLGVFPSEIIVRKILAIDTTKHFFNNEGRAIADSLPRYSLEDDQGPIEMTIEVQNEKGITLYYDY